MAGIPNIKVGDIVEVKKNHPCGGNMFKILRTGSDIKISCIKCSRIVSVERIKFEKNIKKIIPKEGCINE